LVTSFTFNPRTIELYQSGKKPSSKIAALTSVVVGRELVMSPRDVQDLQIVQTLPPQNADSVSIFIFCKGIFLKPTLIEGSCHRSTQ
jgi:hypothetical protein